MKKKRRFEEAKENEEIFNSHCIDHPLPISSSILENCVIDSIPDPNPAVSTFPTVIDSTLIQDINEVFDFGTARLDLHKKGSRFEWTKEEISHLQYFIMHIEPTLSESERKNKYASCLAYLKRADSNIQKDFHPFHCENSGRIKTGYEVAFKKLEIQE